MYILVYLGITVGIDQYNQLKKLDKEYQERCDNCDMIQLDRQIRCDWSKYASIERPPFDNARLSEFRYRLGADQFMISEALLVPNGRVKNIPRYFGIFHL